MDILSVLVQIICAPSILILIMVLSKFRYSRQTTIIATTLMTVFLIAVDFCVVFFGDHLVESYPLLDFIYRISNILVAAIIAAFLTRQQADQMLFIVLSVCVSTYIVDTIALTIRTWIGLYPLELAFELLLYPLMILLIIRIRRPFLEVIEYMKGNIWPLFFAPALLLACFLLQISIPKRLVDAPENIPVALILCGVTITVYVLFYYLFRAIHTKNALEHYAMTMKRSAYSLENQNSLAAQNEKKISLFRHDLRHITQMMAACLDNGDISSARELLSTIDKNIGAWGTSAFQSFTNNKLLNATLCYYIDLAKESKIDISVRMSRMDGVAVDMNELAVVLANALENAIEACKRLPDGAPRTIRMDGRLRGKQYFLELVNTCDGEISFHPDTGIPVSHEDGHGAGSQSIAYFAEKYNAVLQYQLKNNWFHLRLLI